MVEVWTHADALAEMDDCESLRLRFRSRRPADQTTLGKDDADKDAAHAKLEALHGQLEEEKKA
eukprot:gene47431-31736_t